MPILKLKPACKDYLWGGRRLIDEFGKQTDKDRMAESWELSCHPDGLSVIDGGEFDGMTLVDYIEKNGRRVLGSNCQIFSDFPILIKLIDAQGNLSVQVHPNNIDALEHEHQYGKTEMWYVIDAEPDAYLYYGFDHEISEDEFRARIENGTLTDVLNKVPVKKGDMFFIPAGTIHAICKGILIAEVQQSSNVTYRVFDYNRVGADGEPRQLHIPQAIRVTLLTPPKTDYNFGGHLARCAYFTADSKTAPWSDLCGDESFVSILVLEGDGTVKCGGEELVCKKGDSIFLPAFSGKYEVTGSVRALVSSVGTI